VVSFTQKWESLEHNEGEHIFWKWETGMNRVLYYGTLQVLVLPVAGI
jgi:hypothetical protein